MEKNQYNNKDQEHGYWESYRSNGKPIYKGEYINGNRTGYWEWYDNYGKLMIQIFYA